MPVKRPTMPDEDLCQTEMLLCNHICWKLLMHCTDLWLVYSSLAVLFHPAPTAVWYDNAEVGKSQDSVKRLQNNQMIQKMTIMRKKEMQNYINRHKHV